MLLVPSVCCDAHVLIQARPRTEAGLDYRYTPGSDLVVLIGASIQRLSHLVNRKTNSPPIN